MAVDEPLETLLDNLQNERKWRNVQVVLPESFMLVARVLKDQTQIIRKLQSRVEDLESALVKSKDVTSSIAEMEERVRGDLKRQLARVRKEFLVHFEQQQRQVVTQQCNKTEERLDKVVENIQHQIKDLELQFKSERLQDESKLVKLRQEVVELLEVKMMENTTKEIPLATPEIQETQVESIRVELTDFQTTMESQIAVLRQELLVAIGKKMCKIEATKLLSRKMDASTSSTSEIKARSDAFVFSSQWTFGSNLQRKRIVHEWKRLRVL
ncbi:hypothetical protein DVH05_023284 [Phytophthora capsici]|nr:hypothetical protein DVH05_023284 [Phytophthora capsici]